MNNSNKRTKLSMDMDKQNNKSDVVNLRQREFGLLSPSNFAHRLSASQDLILRMEIYNKLNKHKGCVNTISFSPGGDILLSGSDDKRVILWDWETGKVNLSFHSGHHNNVFQAKFMPFTDDRTIVTCAADGQVRVAHILECGQVETAHLAKHDGIAHKLAVEPGSPHIFYTCGEDGLVQHIDLRTRAATRLFTCYSVNTRRGNPSITNLNAISINPRNPNFFAVGGTDKYARLFDIRKYKWDGSSDFGQPVNYFCPSHLIDDISVGITGLTFSNQSEILISYNDELIYLFSKDMGLGHDPEELDTVSGPLSDASPVKGGSDEKASPQVYKGHKNCETVKGVNFFGPRCEYVMSGSDCGRIFIWKKKGGELIRVMEGDKHIVNCINAHPHSTVLASSGIETDIKIWTPKAIEKATLPVNIEQVLLHRRFHCFAFDDDDKDEEDDFFDDDMVYDIEDDDSDDDDDNGDDGDNDNNDDDDDSDNDNDDSEYDCGGGGDDDDNKDNNDDDDDNKDNNDDDDDGNNANLDGANADANDADNDFEISLSS